jgi:hypothetical protein
MKWHIGCESLGKTTFRFRKHWLHKSYGFYAIKGRGHTILFVKPEGTRQDNIKTDPKHMGYDGVYWILLAPDRDRWRAVVNTATNIRVS